MTSARIVVIVCLVAIAAPAYAQSVEAEVLFRDGKKLMKEGKLAEACEKLEASDRLEASVGTELNLADCREKNGQLATAWAAFHKAAATARAVNDVKREGEARRRAGVLEPRLSSLAINVPDAAKVPGLQIARNGTALDPALWNQAIPVDPGDYEVAAKAPGRERWTSKIKVAGEARKATVEVPPLKAPGLPSPDSAQPPRSAEVTAEGPGAGDQVDHGPRVSVFTDKRRIAVSGAVVGVASMVLGGVFGSKANSTERQSNMICPQAACNDMHALQLNSDAKTYALIANVGLFGGGALVAGAAVLWFVGAPKVANGDAAVAPIVGGGTVGLGLSGRF